MSNETQLPPGQYELNEFPRFGLPQFANRVPKETRDVEPLPVAHGAPLRLVAPAHYGHKSAKHLCAIEFWRDDRHFRSPSTFRFMTHPRARVAFEERGTGVPGWLLRYLYRPMVRPGIWLFQRALKRHTTTNARPSARAPR